MTNIPGLSAVLGLLGRIRSLLYGFFRRWEIETEMDEEFRHHIQLRTQHLMREGLSRKEAARRARIEFGHVEAHKDAARVSRGLRWFDEIRFSWLDVKLAWRMLMKSPGLTVIGILGIALGTAVEIGFFVVFSNFFYPNLPLEEGDRVVALSNWDPATNRRVPPTVQEFTTWREELRSVERIAAASLGRRALVIGRAEPQIVRAAAMTATGFQVARVPPLLGRYLLPADQREGAPRVAVIGYDLWQARFAGDPGVMGRTVLVDGIEHSIVGVMPAGFTFPENQELWTALRAGRTGYERGAGPELFVFGRLAPGADREQAQAELTAISRRTETAVPDANARLRPQVLPYTYPLENIDDLTLWEAAGVQFMVNLLLIAVVVNVAVLVYARTATRRRDIAVRSALGASRRRIVVQLFMEALLLSILGTGFGLVVAHAALAQMQAIFDPEGAAFWIDYGVQPSSVAFALALAILCGVVIGVVPALKSTGRNLQASLRRAGSGSSVRPGWAWTALIVAQVAVAVAVLPTAVHIGFSEIKMRSVRATFSAHGFLTANIGLAPPGAGMDVRADGQETTNRLADLLHELERRLEAEPTVLGATFNGKLPGRGSIVEIMRVADPTKPDAHRISSRGIATDYFDVVEARILAGTNVHPPTSNVGTGVVVNEAFVRQVLGGSSALGRRVRFLAPAANAGQPERVPTSPWLDIVGVVENLRASILDHKIAPPTVYYAISPGRLQWASLLVHVRGGDASGFAPQLRQITAAVDQDLRLMSVANLAATLYPRYLAVAITVLVLALGTVLLLSAAGIHALMSLTVTRRRKEIGIRSALGARPGRVLASIFSRAAWQLGLGGLFGIVLGGWLLFARGLTGQTAALILGGVVIMMVLAGLTATMGPARKGLGIQPMKALGEE